MTLQCVAREVRRRHGDENVDGDGGRNRDVDGGPYRLDGVVDGWLVVEQQLPALKRDEGDGGGDDGPSREQAAVAERQRPRLDGRRVDDAAHPERQQNADFAADEQVLDDAGRATAEEVETDERSDDGHRQQRSKRNAEGGLGESESERELTEGEGVHRHRADVAEQQRPADHAGDGRVAGEMLDERHGAAALVGQSVQRGVGVAGTQRDDAGEDERQPRRRAGDGRDDAEDGEDAAAYHPAQRD